MKKIRIKVCLRFADGGEEESIRWFALGSVYRSVEAIAKMYGAKSYAVYRWEGGCWSLNGSGKIVD